MTNMHLVSMYYFKLYHSIEIILYNGEFLFKLLNDNFENDQMSKTSQMR